MATEKNDSTLRGSDSSLDHARGGKSEKIERHSTSHDEDFTMTEKLDNPLLGKTEDELRHDVKEFLTKSGIDDDEELFFLGSLIAQDTDNFERLADRMTEEQLKWLRFEKTHKWKQPAMLYYEVLLVSMAAVVQGMVQTVINGANLYWPQQFGIGSDSQRDTLLLGLTASAPYLCSAVLGCWLTYPLNYWFGRRGAIFISTFFAGACCIWSAVTNTWWHLFIARFILGLGIGPKSATAPVLSVEVAPAPIRGALAMQWQMWTAFGIMLGTASSLIFKGVPDQSGITGLNWRLMLGSAVLPAIIVCAQVYFVPESPRWLIGKGKYKKAYESFKRLRTNKLIAARDMFYTTVAIELEEHIASQVSRNKLVEIVALPRNRRAMLASTIVMFGQQFCGVNAIAYYASSIFNEVTNDNTKALLGSWGFGMINWLFALPAFIGMDRWGRRTLLLSTFPFLALFMVVGGLGFLHPDPQSSLAIVSVGIYFFTAFYSFGMGPVPFSYSAEVYPLQVREIGMALATATTWLFNFVVALTFPLLLVAFTPTGAFCWFAAWNVALYTLVLLFLPETKLLTLEELDQVFSVPTHKQMAYGLQTLPYSFNKYILRNKKAHRMKLYPWEGKDHAEVEHRELA